MTFLAIFLVKECLCDTPGVRQRVLARARVCDQNVQFLRLKVGSCPNHDNYVQIYFLSFSVQYLIIFIF